MDTNLWWKVIIPSGTLVFLFTVFFIVSLSYAKEVRVTTTKFFIGFFAFLELGIAAFCFVQYGKDMYGRGRVDGFNTANGWTENSDGSWSITLPISIETEPDPNKDAPEKDPKEDNLTD